MNLTTSQTNHITIELTSEDLRRAVLDFAAKVYMGHGVGEGFTVTRIVAEADDTGNALGAEESSRYLAISSVSMMLTKTTVKP